MARKAGNGDNGQKQQQGDSIPGLEDEGMIDSAGGGARKRMMNRSYLTMASNGQQLPRNSHAAAAKERTVKNFLDVIILYKLKEDFSHGYELIKFIHKEFGVFLSPGTVYPVLYDLEKNGLVRSEMAGKKRMYALADPLAAEAIFEGFRSAHLKLARVVGMDMANAALPARQ